MAEMVKAKLNDQHFIYLPKHRADRPEWYTDKGWERKRLYSMYLKIKEGDTIFYVGAEEGEMPALCQIWGAKVVMFEPNAKVWPNIKAIWQANNLDGPLVCVPGFASNKDFDTQYTMNVFPAVADGEVIGDHGFKELHDPDNIPQIKIDTLVQRLGIIPTAISLDVEGSEWEVLRGAEDTLRKYRPKIWLSGHPEFLFRIYGEYLGDLRTWIKNIGYTETLLDYDHEVHLLYE